MEESLGFDPLDPCSLVPVAADVSRQFGDLAIVTGMAWDLSAAHSFNRAVAEHIAKRAIERLKLPASRENLSAVSLATLCIFQDVAARWLWQHNRRIRPSISGFVAARMTRIVEVSSAACYQSEIEDIVATSSCTSEAFAPTEDRAVVVHRLWDVLDAFPSTTRFFVYGFDEAK